MRLESEGASGEGVDFGETFADLWMRNTKGNRVQAEGPLVRPRAHTFSLMGNDAPTTAREWDLPSHGALTLFFRWRKKSVQKKASGTALQRRPAPLRVAGFGLREPFGLSSASVRFAHPPGKGPLLPILTAGLAMSRAMELDSFHQFLERARARLFPSAAYRRSAPPQVALGRLKWRCLGRFCVAWIFLLHKRPA